MEFDHSINYFDITGAARKVYSRYLEPLCKKWALTRNELDVLLYLYNHPGLDRAVDISEGRGMAKSHVSQSVASLEGRGLLHREFDPADRRTAHLALTELSLPIAEEGKLLQQDFFAAIHEGVTPEELMLWGGIIRKVCGNIESLSMQ